MMWLFEKVMKERGMLVFREENEHSFGGTYALLKITCFSDTRNDFFYYLRLSIIYSMRMGYYPRIMLCPAIFLSFSTIAEGSHRAQLSRITERGSGTSSLLSSWTVLPDSSLASDGPFSARTIDVLKRSTTSSPATGIVIRSSSIGREKVDRSNAEEDFRKLL